MNPRLIAAAVLLADVLAAENAALAALDFARAAALLGEKRSAAAALAAAQHLAEATATPATPEGRQLAERLHDLAHTNRRLLEHALRVQGRVLGMVARALPRPPLPRYGAGGAATQGPVAPLVMSARV